MNALNTPVPATPRFPAPKGATDAATPPDRDWPVRAFVLPGLIALALLCGGLVVWGATVPISGAVIAAGRIAVAGDAVTVAHLDGGRVAMRAVSEHDRVAAGDLLIRLEGDGLIEEAARIARRRSEIAVRMARLEAERDGRDALRPPDTFSGPEAPEQVAMLRGQQDLLAAHRQTLADMDAHLADRTALHARERDALGAQDAALADQIRLVSEERDAQTALMERGLTQTARLSGLNREVARLSAARAAIQAEMARLDGRDADLAQDVIRHRAEARTRAVAELRDLALQAADLAARAAELDGRIARLDIRAPVSGTLHEVERVAAGAVLMPGAPVARIIPGGRMATVQASVAAADIEDVRPGQPAMLRFPTLDPTRSGTVAGHVRAVAPDAHEAAPGVMRYRLEIEMETGAATRLTYLLRPGIPVDAFLRTGDRTLLRYLVQPLERYFGRAFREP
ncbi:HlyD family type I secretion periplasmic adaptor subunit [uncultured Jannaschia sp.]|uniref:HlyD family type I secretion periplasmic adaptor subunit n=1 Tax=uncultured Jannaschia sp. TaxID=293347 RepID=UPI0026103EC3|nr:HlyD family type I secretion periplasmic adaptor subunit [uncultured Jannaschia sp.]